MNPNETRSSHPSSAQVETLIEFMERNSGIAKGFLTTQNARERSRRQREELAVRLNSLGGTVKNYTQWTKNIQLEHTPPPNPHIYHPSLSPPPITLSHTPTPFPSRCGSTPIASPVIRHRTAASSSSRHATPIASPSRRPRTNMARASRGASSLSTRHTSLVTAPPPSQWRTEISTTTERFLRVKEQQLEIQRLNAQILQSFLERSAERERAMDERSAERDKILAEAVAAVGKGLQALAEAKNRDRV